MLSVDDLVYSGITLAKAAYVAVIATCGAQVVSGTGTCAASEGRLPLPVYVLALITLVGLGVWLHSWVSEAWENEEGVFGTVSALRFRFGDRVKLPLREKTGTPEWWAKQVVVVTGGAGGLGWATSGRILAQGARVAVWDVKKPQALFHASDKELLTPSQRSRIMFTKCNVADRQSVIAAVADLQAKFGPATVLVNNAGIQSGVGKTLDKLSGEEVTRIFGINVLSHFWTLQALLPDMLKTGTGHIVSIASIMGQMPIAHLSDYVATKHAIKGMHYSLRRELDNVHHTPFVRTTYVALGRMKTPLFQHIKYDTASEFFAPTLDHDLVAQHIVQELASGRSGAIRLPLHAKLLWIVDLFPGWALDLIYAVAHVDSAMN